MMEIDMTHDIGAIIEAIEQYTRGDDHQRAIDAAVEVLRAVESRESALIAERDAIRAAARQFYNLTIADPDVLIRAFTESKREAIIETGRVLAAALAAPAVEGGCDGHKKIRDSATTLDAELASLNAMRYNRTL